VRLTVRDRAGNATTVSRRFTPRVVTPIRRLRVSGQISRRHARLKVRGRLVRRAAVRVRLRPLRGGLRPATVRPLGARPAGRSVARAKAPSHRGGFTVPIALRSARPGLYRLEVRTTERGRRAGAPLVRAVRITR